MKSKMKLLLATSFSIGMMFAASGCGSSNNTSGNAHVIIVHDGVYGYYYNTEFCDYYNNYCGTGYDYGISSNGCYYNNSYACGGYSDGSSGYYTSGGYSGGYYSDGSTGGYYGSSGSTGGYYGSSGSSGYSTSATTKDVDLQRSLVEQKDLQDRAQTVATQFKMSIEGARQLTQLADTMQKLTAAGKFTGEDQMAISSAALSVAGIKQEEFKGAMADYMNNHNKNAFDSLITKGASNLGMPSTAALRDQILPSLGLNVNNL